MRAGERHGKAFESVFGDADEWPRVNTGQKSCQPATAVFFRQKRLGGASFGMFHRSRV